MPITLLTKDQAREVVRKMTSHESVPEKGVLVKLSERAAGALVRDLKAHDDFKARSLSKGAKKVVR